jgi:hypothetical protein
MANVNNKNSEDQVLKLQLCLSQQSQRDDGKNKGTAKEVVRKTITILAQKPSEKCFKQLQQLG